MSVYIAGKYTSRERLKAVRERARSELNLPVTSSWMDEQWEDYNAPDEVRRENAQRDLDEVDQAHTFIIDTIDESATGGREVELGAALLGDKNLCIIGPRRNVFHYLIEAHYASWDEWFVAGAAYRILAGI